VAYGGGVPFVIESNIRYPAHVPYRCAPIRVIVLANSSGAPRVLQRCGFETGGSFAHDPRDVHGPALGAGVCCATHANRGMSKCDAHAGYKSSVSTSQHATMQ
jgi:hypothetical protein